MYETDDASHIVKCVINIVMNWYNMYECLA